MKLGSQRQSAVPSRGKAWGQDVIAKYPPSGVGGTPDHISWDEGAYRAEFFRAQEMLDHHPMLVVDRNFQIVWRCDRTPHLLESPVPLCIRNDHLVVDDELGPGRFAHFLKNLDEAPKRFLVRGRSTPHWAMVSAWQNPQMPGGIFLVCTLSTPHCNVAQSGIAEDLGLTRAETIVLAEFAYLKAPKDIADSLGISLSTVRSHLKQIYAKASVQTGVQLSLLVQAYCSV